MKKQSSRSVTKDRLGRKTLATKTPSAQSLVTVILPPPPGKQPIPFLVAEHPGVVPLQGDEADQWKATPPPLPAGAQTAGQAGETEDCRQVREGSLTYHQLGKLSLGPACFCKLYMIIFPISTAIYQKLVSM